MYGARNTHGRGENEYETLVRKLRGRDHLPHLDIEGSIILK